MNVERIQILAVAQEIVDANRTKFKHEDLEVNDLLYMYQEYVSSTEYSINIIEAIYGLLSIMTRDKEMDTGWWMAWGNVLDQILFIFERNYLDGVPSPPYHFAFPIEQQRMFELVRRVAARYIHAQQ